ncbi:MAG TPA: DegV family protein, partial [Halanaerobiales bacterium]|nr:DegV family protein [Halanaerobiales bacterium]
MKIGLVTDSTCDLKSNIIEKFNIEIVPLTVH